MKKAVKKKAVKGSVPSKIAEEILYSTLLSSFSALFQTDKKVAKRWFPRIRKLRNACNVILGE